MNKATTKSVLFLVSLGLAVTQIVRYENEFVAKTTPIRQMVYDSIYSIVDTPEIGETPSIDYNLNFYSEEPKQTAFMVVGNRQSILKEGVLDLKLQLCTEKGQRATNLKLKVKIPFEKDSRGLYGELKGSFKVTKTGLYTTVFVVCGSGMKVDGYVEYRNSYGYLSAHLYNYYPYHIIVMIVYSTLALIWAWNIRGHKTVVHHRAIEVTIFLNIFENLTKYIDDYLINHYGTRSGIMTILVVSLTISRKLFLRIVVLILCCGYGLIRMKLTRQKQSMILALSIVYCLTSLMQHANYVDTILIYESTPRFEGLMRWCTNLINLFFYGWSLWELKNSLESLKCREKCYQKVYKIFASVMLLGLLSTTYFFYQRFHFMRNDLRSHYLWEDFWFYQCGYWVFQYTILLCFAMYLWRPGQKFNYRNLEIEFKIPSNPFNSIKNLNLDDPESEYSYSSMDNEKSIQPKNGKFFRNSDIHKAIKKHLETEDKKDGDFLNLENRENPTKAQKKESSESREEEIKSELLSMPYTLGRNEYTVEAESLSEGEEKKDAEHLIRIGGNKVSKKND